MTPGQARVQRVMAPGARVPGRPARRPQPFREFGQRGHPQAVGDQFQRQRKPARLTADAARKRQLAGSSSQFHPRHGSPGKEQRHRLRRNRMASLARNSHGLHPPHALGLDIERAAARHQHPQVRGPPGQLIAGTTGRFQHVLAVVQHQQRPAARHCTEQPFSAILPRRLTRSRLRRRPSGSLRSPEAGALTAGSEWVCAGARGRFDRRRVVNFPRETRGR
jgi:hypothetical protein